MDIDSIANMFSETILLRDWKISVNGIQAALAETQKNFDASESIEIDILGLYSSKNTVAGELKIVVNSSEVLYVTDIISFNDEGKIEAIRAYIGRGDN